MRRRKRTRDNGVFSQINVTPLVDVMLVLLIVFMIAAPLTVQMSTREIGLENGEAKIETSLFVSDDGSISSSDWGGERVKDVVMWAKGRLEGNDEKILYLHGSANVKYSYIEDLINKLQRANNENVIDLAKIFLVMPNNTDIPVDTKQ